MLGKRSASRSPGAVAASVASAADGAPATSHTHTHSRDSSDAATQRSTNASRRGDEITSSQDSAASQGSPTLRKALRRADSRASSDAAGRASLRAHTRTHAHTSPPATLTRSSSRARAAVISATDTDAATASASAAASAISAISVPSTHTHTHTHAHTQPSPASSPTHAATTTSPQPSTPPRSSVRSESHLPPPRAPKAVRTRSRAFTRARTHTHTHAHAQSRGDGATSGQAVDEDDSDASSESASASDAAATHDDVPRRRVLAVRRRLFPDEDADGASDGAGDVGGRPHSAQDPQASEGSHASVAERASPRPINDATDVIATASRHLSSARAVLATSAEHATIHGTPQRTRLGGVDGVATSPFSSAAFPLPPTGPGGFLPLPVHFGSLLDSFKALDTVLTVYQRRRAQATSGGSSSPLPTFEAVRLSVESASGHPFTMDTLKAIVGVAPTAYKLAFFRVTSDNMPADDSLRPSTSGAAGKVSWRLVLEVNPEYAQAEAARLEGLIISESPARGATPPRRALPAHPAYSPARGSPASRPDNMAAASPPRPTRTAGPAGSSLQPVLALSLRRDLFKAALLLLVDAAHNDYMRQQRISTMPAGHWCAGFRLADVPLPIGSLPTPPSTPGTASSSAVAATEPAPGAITAAAANRLHELRTVETVKQQALNDSVVRARALQVAAAECLTSIRAAAAPSAPSRPTPAAAASSLPASLLARVRAKTAAAEGTAAPSSSPSGTSAASSSSAGLMNSVAAARHLVEVVQAVFINSAKEAFPLSDLVARLRTQAGVNAKDADIVSALNKLLNWMPQWARLKTLSSGPVFRLLTPLTTAEMEAALAAHAAELV